MQPTFQVIKTNDRETDLLRLTDLCQQHGLSFRWQGKCCEFDDRAPPEAFSDGCIYFAGNLSEALAFAEGYDRAMQHDR